MQRINTMNQQMFQQQQAERRRELSSAAERLVQRLLGCWQHELSRPFTYEQRTYRVCLKCGLSRDFNPITWKTHGPSYSLAASSISAN